MRIWIVGGPKSGKTNAARLLGAGLEVQVHHISAEGDLRETSNLGAGVFDVEVQMTKRYRSYIREVDTIIEMAGRKARVTQGLVPPGLAAILE